MGIPDSYEAEIAQAIDEAVDEAIAEEEDGIYDAMRDKVLAEIDDLIEHRYCEARRRRCNELYVEIQPKVREKFAAQIRETARLQGGG